MTRIAPKPGASLGIHFFSRTNTPHSHENQWNSLNISDLNTLFTAFQENGSLENMEDFKEKFIALVINLEKTSEKNLFDLITSSRKAQFLKIHSTTELINLAHVLSHPWYNPEILAPPENLPEWMHQVEILAWKLFNKKISEAWNYLNKKKIVLNPHPENTWKSRPIITPKLRIEEVNGKIIEILKVDEDVRPFTSGVKGIETTKDITKTGEREIGTLGDIITQQLNTLAGRNEWLEIFQDNFSDIHKGTRIISYTTDPQGINHLHSSALIQSLNGDRQKILSFSDFFRTGWNLTATPEQINKYFTSLEKIRKEENPEQDNAPLNLEQLQLGNLEEFELSTAQLLGDKMVEYIQQTTDEFTYEASFTGFYTTCKALSKAGITMSIGITNELPAIPLLESLGALIGEECVLPYSMRTIHGAGRPTRTYKVYLLHSNICKGFERFGLSTIIDRTKENAKERIKANLKDSKSR